MRELGALLPLYTNDNSDLMVLHCGGPLDGRLSYVPHDDSTMTLAFHSLDSFDAERAEAGDDEISLGQYMTGSDAEKNAARLAVKQLRKAIGIPDNVDIEYLAHIWERFRGGYPALKEK